MFKALVDKISEYDTAVLGFSGGVDSSLVAYALKTSGVSFICVTVQTPLQTKRDLAQSAFFCKEYGIEHKLITLNVLDVTQVNNNHKDRCYHCKKAIFGRLCELADGMGYNAVMDGSNADDLKEYRPGLKAKEELGVISPLADLGFTKSDVRRISRELGLPTWDLPSSPCLATRIPYNTPIDTRIINSVEQAENVLAKMGASGIRVRAHGNIARIESEDIDTVYRLLNEDTVQRIKDCGFEFVCLDMDGYKRGCYD